MRPQIKCPACAVVGVLGLIISQATTAQDTDPVPPSRGVQTAEKDQAPADRLADPDRGPNAPSALDQRSNKKATGHARSIVREPSQGRPIFITPGDTFYFVMNLPPDFKGNVGFALQHALEPAIRFPLKPATPPSYVNNEYCSLVLQVSPNTEAGLYDLGVRTDSATYFSRRSVKVLNAFKDRFRFVHLSNMNVGDLTAPDFDDMLPKEINLLAPEFIVATGDYTEWARALDDASSWLRVLKYFERFHAPVYMLCGLHDHQASFTRFVANKPIGTIDYGNYHGILLLDHPGNPIDQDYAQIQWVEADLRRNRLRRMNFLAANSDDLGILDVWRERGNIDTFVREHNIRMLISGGSTDWDYREFADKFAGLEDLHFIRTHQSSTCMRDRATGFSHYRVIEVDGDELSYVYADDIASERLQHSVPTGRLRTFFDAPNDGSASRITATIQNALNQRFDDTRLWLRVAKKGEVKPIVSPGRTVAVLDADRYWACEVAVDLPDKGAVRVMASMNPADIPPPLPLTVGLEGPREWDFALETTDFGLSYFVSDARVLLALTNQTQKPLPCWPVIRINGAQIHPDRSEVHRLPVIVDPEATLSIPLVLSLRRVSPGPHQLQVHFLEDPLSRLSTFDVELAVKSESVSSRAEPAGASQGN